VTAGPAGDGTVRAGVRARLGFPLDPFQAAAFDALDWECSVLVSAPTGSGKPVVPDYGVGRGARGGLGAF